MFELKLASKVRMWLMAAVQFLIGLFGYYHASSNFRSTYLITFLIIGLLILAGSFIPKIVAKIPEKNAQLSSNQKFERGMGLVLVAISLFCFMLDNETVLLITLDTGLLFALFPAEPAFALWK